MKHQGLESKFAMVSIWRNNRDIDIRLVNHPHHSQTCVNDAIVLYWNFEVISVLIHMHLSILYEEREEST